MSNRVLDAVPEGFIPVKLAFERYCDRLGSYDADADRAEMLGAFRRGELLALARTPGENGNRRVEASTWGGGADPDLRFIEQAVPADRSTEPWNTFAGRTLFVGESEFENWVTAIERRYDPLLEGWWTLAMATMWLLHGDAGAIRKVWPEYLEATGRHRADLGTITLTELGVDAAVQQIRRVLRDGEILTRGRLPGGGAEEIDAVTWHDLTLTYSALPGMREEWRVSGNMGQVRYVEIFVPRDFVVSLRQPRGLSLTAKAKNATEPGADNSLAQDQASRSGAPGRPSSMHLVMAEFDRRREVGEPLADSLRAEADSLLAWLEGAHPGMPNLTAKTIRNRLAERYRATRHAAERPIL